MIVESLLMATVLQVGAQDTLSLAAAIQRAREVRRQPAVAGAIAAEARANVGLAGAIPNPLLTYVHSETSPTEEAKVEQDLGWIIRRWDSRSAAVASLRSARADSTQIMADLVRDVKVAYFRALGAAETRRLAGEQGQMADSLARQAAERVEAGDISVVERQQFELEAARARQIVAQAREDERVARAALIRALGDSTLNAVALMGPLDIDLDLPWPARPAREEEVPALERALGDSAAARALHRVAQLQRLPLPSLMLGREWDSGPFANGSHALLGFSVPVPLWNIGSSAGAAAQARADRAAAIAVETRLDVTRALSAAEARLTGTRDRARFSRDSLLPAAIRLRVGIVRLYRAGQTAVLPVFDALRTERDVTIGTIRDLLAYQEALAGWLALLGRAE